MSQMVFASIETLDRIEESRIARLTRNRDQYRSLSRRTKALLRKEKEGYVRGLAQNVKCHSSANDLRPAY